MLSFRQRRQRALNHVSAYKARRTDASCEHTHRDTHRRLFSPHASVPGRPGHAQKLW